MWDRTDWSAISLISYAQEQSLILFWDLGIRKSRVRVGENTETLAWRIREIYQAAVQIAPFAVGAFGAISRSAAVVALLGTVHVRCLYTEGRN